MSNTPSTRAAAAAALATYREQPGHGGTNARESITDLITDLLHLADQEHEAETPADDDTASGETILDAAEANYYEEREEAAAPSV